MRSKMDFEMNSKMKSKIGESFDQIHAEDELKDSTRAFLQSRIRQEQTVGNWSGGRNFVAAAAGFVFFVLAAGGGYHLYFTPVSAISVDVNPSVELEVNRFDRVIEVEAYNEDGKLLAATVDLKHKNYEQALDTLMESAAMQNYLEQDGLVSITVLGENEEKSSQMLTCINACSYMNQSNVTCHAGNREEVEQAHEAGLSFGKYQAYKELHLADPTVTTEDVKGLTMRQIYDRIEACTGEAAGREHAGAGKGHGSGNGTGNPGGIHRNQSQNQIQNQSQNQSQNQTESHHESDIVKNPHG